MAGPDSPEHLQELIDRYNDAWNRQDVAAIAAMHTDDIVFHNHTAGERVEGRDAVSAHIAGIFGNWPGMQFSGRGPVPARRPGRAGVDRHRHTCAEREERHVGWDGHPADA